MALCSAAETIVMIGGVSYACWSQKRLRFGAMQRLVIFTVSRPMDTHLLAT